MQIRQRKYRSGKIAYQLNVGLVNGKRIQLSFATKKQAEEKRDDLLKRRKNFGERALAMTEAQRIRYAEAEHRLSLVGLSLEAAVEIAIKHGKIRKEPVTLEVLVKLFQVEKNARNKRPRYLRQLRVSLGSLVRGRELRPAQSIDRDEIREWLFGNGWSPKTQRNYLGDVRTLFNWAMREGYVAVSPALNIETAHAEDREISVLTVEQCQRLLMTAIEHLAKRLVRSTQVYTETHIYRPLLGYAVLAMFGGIRPEEIKRSPRSVIDLEHRTVVVTAARAKTRQRRVVDLSENAVAWLKLWMRLCPDQEAIVPKNFRNLWARLREEAALKPEGWPFRKGAAAPSVEPWPADVLRHTFASMHHAFYQDAAKLQAQLGHSDDEDTLYKNYRAVTMANGQAVSKTIAKEFWSLMPPAD